VRSLVLGFDSRPIWSIFFDEKKKIEVVLEEGDMAIYKGCDIHHWRPEFKGTWHVQVFFHYVDASGPYKNHLFDKRSDKDIGLFLTGKRY
jgi:hypothetical protein